MTDQKQIGDLREIFFKQMERLADPANDLAVEKIRTEALVNAGRVIIESAKTEVDFMRITKGKGSGFIPELPQGDQPKELGNGN